MSYSFIRNQITPCLGCLEACVMLLHCCHTGINLVLEPYQLSLWVILLVLKVTSYMTWSPDIFFISRDVQFHEHLFPFHDAYPHVEVPDLFADVVLPNLIPSFEIVTPAPEPTLSDPNLMPEASSPALLPLRKSTRTCRPPFHLQAYDCSYIVPYPISNHLSYQRLNPAFKQFICQVSTIPEPFFYHQAVKSPLWQQAMQEELQALEENNTWSIVPLPSGKHTIGSKWVYRVTYLPNGDVDRYKARLVAKGYTQQAGVDFTDTFSPIAKLTTVRLLLFIAAIQGWSLLQLDVNNAFLNGELFEEVFMDLPVGCLKQTLSMVCKLNKSLYGLRQASPQWFYKFSSALTDKGFTNQRLTIHSSPLAQVLILLYS